MIHSIPFRYPRLLMGVLGVFVLVGVSAQFPYVRKMNYPAQLPTQVVYNMHSDTRGYIWLATDKGLFRSNGKSFLSIPFDNTHLKSVSYLREDNQGVIWCMNFYNQVFSVRNDTLRKFHMDSEVITNASSFLNLGVSDEYLWLTSFSKIYRINKINRKVAAEINVQGPLDMVTGSAVFNNRYNAISYRGYIIQDPDAGGGWKNLKTRFSQNMLLKGNKGLIKLSLGLDQSLPVEIVGDVITTLPGIKLPKDAYIFHGVYIEKNNYWLCTQNGAYRWKPETGETEWILPNQRVTDVVKDYQGNYWISTLDNGVFICPSLNNTLINMFGNPLLDNYSKVEVLPSGDVFAGNTRGQLAKYSGSTGGITNYHVDKGGEIEFIKYDSTQNIIFFNRGVVKNEGSQPIDVFDYSKGVDRDKFGNILVAVFNGALVLNNHFGNKNRAPELKCPLYTSDKTSIVMHADTRSVLRLRPRRCNAILSSADKSQFWVAYDDALYQYDYSITIRELRDGAGEPVVGRSMVQLADGRLVVGTSVKGVILFSKGKYAQTIDIKNGLSSNIIRKVIARGNDIWVLTAEGLDRINLLTGTINNYLDEYGLGEIIINDFVLKQDTLLLATPSGILLRKNRTGKENTLIRFPVLRVFNNNQEINNGSTLNVGESEIYIAFEALHFVSSGALDYRYRLKGLDTVWRYMGNSGNRLTFSRLSAGKYTFQIQALAGANYKSEVRSFAFVVPKKFIQKTWVLVSLFLIVGLLVWLALRQWKKSLLTRQTVREDLLKSQLIAIRAQMNPHFLYNVLNTVQGLVYGNRKAEAGALLGNFSDLMRKILQSSDKQFLNLKDEIENLRLYLELEKARFDEGFSFTIEIKGLTDISSIQVPSLLIQPFAENAVKHGLLHKKGSKLLGIQFEQQNDRLMVTIEDNGIGRQKSREINARNKNKSEGFATLALNERMALFNRLFDEKITCVITDKVDEKGQPTGTRTVILIPDYNNGTNEL